jgi:hypothetical protein
MALMSGGATAMGGVGGGGRGLGPSPARQPSKPTPAWVCDLAGV